MEKSEIGEGVTHETLAGEYPAYQETAGDRWGLLLLGMIVCFLLGLAVGALSTPKPKTCEVPTYNRGQFTDLSRG